MNSNEIYKDEPYYSFPKDYMYIRQEYIINKLLNQKINLKSYYNTDNQKKLQIKVSNQTSIPIELLRITDSDSVFYDFNNYIFRFCFSLLQSNTLFRRNKYGPKK